MGERQGNIVIRAHEAVVNNAPRYLRLGGVGWGLGGAMAGDFVALGMGVAVFLGSSTVIRLDRRGNSLNEKKNNK